MTMRAAVLLVVLSLALSGCLTPRGNGTEDPDGAAPLPNEPTSQNDGTSQPTKGTDDPPTTTATSNATPPPREPDTHTVTIGNALLCMEAPFEPAEIEVVAGDSVVWENADDCTHTASGNGGSFETNNIAAGKKSPPIPFDEPGTFDYICAIHPQMEGTVKVTQA